MSEIAYANFQNSKQLCVAQSGFNPVSEQVNGPNDYSPLSVDLRKSASFF